jgi:membrane-associated phospholipid phosphatase
MVVAPLTPCFAQVSTLPGVSASIAPSTAGTVTTATSAPDVARDSVTGADASTQEASQLQLPRNTFPQTDTWQTPSRPAVPSLAEIFTQTGRDYTRLPSMNTALILGIGAGLAAAVHPVDQRSSNSFSGATSTSGFFKPGATLGSTYTQLGAAFAAYGIGRVSGNSKMALVGADLIRVQLLTEGTNQAIKFIAGRERPNGGSHSFPSGHAASTFATATVLQSHFGWKVGIPAYAFATYVGASRIQMQKHYLSDVAFGAAVGIVAGRTVTVGLGGRKFALAPMTGPNGGVGIGLTRLPK